MSNFFKFILLIFASFIGIVNIYALEKDGEKYKIELINDYYEEVVYKDEFKVISKINKETSDLENGIIDVDIIFDNYQDNEIIYVIDNLSSFGYKDDQINTIKNNIRDLFDSDFIKQGVVVTTKDNKFFTIDFDNIEKELDKINIVELGSEGDIFNAMEYATTLFTTNSKSKKSIVLIVNSLGSESKEVLKKKVNDLETKNINLFVFRTNDMVNIENYLDIFESANYKCIDEYNNDFCIINSNQRKLPVYPCIKIFGKFNVYLDDNILNNYDVEVNPELFYFYDNIIGSRFFLAMNGYQINEGESATFTYSLSLKNDFDKNLIGKEINISKELEGKFSPEYYCDSRFRNGSIVTYDGSTYDDEVFKISDNLSLKIVKEEKSIVNEPIENPKTGIESYVIFGICLMIVSGITYIIINKRKIM